MSNRWIKKPVTITAYDFSKVKVAEDGTQLVDGYDENGKPYINTLEGRHNVREDDFIIFGVQNEKYPCKRDIFFATYDKVE